MRKFHLSIILSFSLVLSSVLATAQESNHGHFDPGHMTCAKNEMTEAFFEEHPEAIPAAQAAHEQLENFTESYADSPQRDDDILIIPVVFHVVHLNGDENISDEQIHSAIDVLNEDFSATTPGLNEVVPEFADIVGNAGVEFRLARRDPDGNCTNGINRVYNEATNDGTGNLKSQVPSWGRESYLNIWVVKAIGSGAAGFAFLPGDVNGFWGQDIDGIVILHNYVGRTGTSNDSRSHALSHEVGHWANLKHTWGGSNTPGLASNCGTDDNVSDTPMTIGWQSCNLSGESCGTLDNVQNFMDYSYCYRMFTLGQKTRIRAALNSGISDRNELHSAANLIATGVTEPDEICVADFKTEVYPELCAGTTISFTDLSYHNPTEWFWTFEGGDPATSQEQNPEVEYDSPGVYPVSLTVSNSTNGLTVTKESYVSVLPVGQYQLPVSEDFQDVTTLDGEDNWFDLNPDQGQIDWEVTDEVGYNDSKSVYVLGRYNLNDAVEELTSPTFDLSGLTEAPLLTFKYAHARRNGLSEDRLRVFISRNCGLDWNLRETIDMDELPTVEGDVGGEFAPDSPDDWREVEISGIVSIFLTSEFRIKFEFTSNRGNNIYIDDINMSGPDAVNEIPAVDNFRMFPNPADQRITVSFSMENPSAVSVDLIDMTGRVIRPFLSKAVSAGEQQFDLDVTGVASGIYMLRVQTDEGTLVERLVIR